MSKRKIRPLHDSEIPKDFLNDRRKFFNGCKFWKWWKELVSGKIFPRACEVCHGCVMHKHESMVGRCMAEGESSACVLALTLTYDPKLSDHHEWLHVRDIELFMKRLRRAGYKVRKFAAGEYGTINGAAHWHVLLFFEWDEQHFEWWHSEELARLMPGSKEVSVVENHSFERKRDWRKFVPPLFLGYADKPKFIRLLDDPEVLWCPSIGRKLSNKVRQTWRFWPYGLVECQLLKSPEHLDPQAVNRGVRYIAKYYSKDPWKDGKLSKVEFEKLPSHVKEATAYGPWDLDGTNERTKWVRGNEYGKAIEQRNLEKYGCDDDVPFNERRRVHRHLSKVVGGLGSAYFKMLGFWYGSNCADQETLAKRTFKLGPSWRKKHIQNLQLSVRSGELQDVKPLNEFYMGDVAFGQFAKGFNEALGSVGRDATTGPDHVFDNLETQRVQSRDMASGGAGLAIWKKSSASQRKTLESIWSDLPLSSLKGLIPHRMILQLEDSSLLPGWQEKRRQRLRQAMQGKVKHLYALRSGATVSVTSSGRVFYTRLDDRGREWWQREVLTVEDMQAALDCTLLPLGARSARLDREGRGDLRPISGLDRRTVLRRIKARCQDDL